MVFTSFVPRLCMMAVPYSRRAGVSPRSALTATLVVTRMLEISKGEEGCAHSEMYKSHSLEELFSNKLANWNVRYVAICKKLLECHQFNSGMKALFISTMNKVPD